MFSLGSGDVEDCAFYEQTYDHNNSLSMDYQELANNSLDLDDDSSENTCPTICIDSKRHLMKNVDINYSLVS